MTQFVENRGLNLAIQLNQEIANEAFTNIINSFGPIEERVLKASEYAKGYGGSYVNDEGRLVVLILIAQDFEKTVANTRERAQSVQDAILLETCTYSYSQLIEAMEAIDAYKLGSSAKSDLGLNIQGAGPYNRINQVIVELKEVTQASVDAFKKEVCDLPCIQFVTAGEPPVDDVNVNCGDAIACNGSGGSVGYRVRLSGANGFLTAGHVAKSTSSTNNANSVTYGGTKCAECTKRQQSGSVDAAYCKITNTSYTPTNNVGSNTLSTTIETLSEGSIVNLRGKNTQSSGKILSTSYSGTFSDIYFTNLVQTDYSRAGGDSGGLVYSYYASSGERRTLGTHKGGSSTRGYYCRAGLIDSALGTSRY